MAYIGNTPAEFYQTLEKQSFTTSATTTYTLNFSVTNPQEIALFINNIRQNPNSSYTVSNLTTLTLSSATSSSDVMYAVFLGKSVGTIAPALNSVTTDMLTGLIAPARLGSGTASSTTFLAGDQTYKEITTTPASGTAWQSVQTTAFTAVAGYAYPCNTTSAAFTVTLPSSASVGDTIQIVDYAGTFATNNITITSSLNIEGGTINKLLTTNREGVTITYADATQGWVATSGVNSGDQALDIQPYSVDFLVIAGGGAGGGSFRGGGGGAGGYRNSFSTETSGGGGGSETNLTFNGGVVYTITVGAGGTGNTTADGSNGSNSLISGTGITTITSTGGGGGDGNYDVAGSAGAGGSGGGGSGGESNVGTGGAGTANQGYAGGNGTTSGQCGGGGGGSSQVGFVGGTGGTNGDGGAGLASSITGSSVTRGGGGGGGNYSSGNVTIGGAGGGGAGGTGIYNNGVNGTVNTGGGAGGSSGNSISGIGGAGGSGVVILRMPTASYSGTTTGSPTVSASGSDTILIYNASGSYTG